MRSNRATVRISGRALLVAALLFGALGEARAEQRYSGVWESGGGGHFLWAGVSWNDFEDKWEELSGQGLRLIDIETYVEGGQRKYAGVWRAGNDGHFLWA